MANTVAKPVDQSKAIADAVDGLDVLAVADKAAADQVAADQMSPREVADLIANSTLVPAAEIAAAFIDLQGPPGVTFVIKGPVQGRWRIGRHFGPESVSILASELTDAQRQALVDDPALMISDV